jgi:predicted PurR-regulated permease PerM
MSSIPESPVERDAPPAIPAPTVSNASVKVRGNAIVVLTLIAMVVFLHWAQAVVIPITFAVFLSYSLTPIVNWLQKRARLPKVVGAAATLTVIIGAVGFGLNSLQSEALDVLDIVPRATEKFSIAIRGNPREPPGAVEKMKKAATEIENVANTFTATTANDHGWRPTPPPRTRTQPKIRDYC